MHAPQRPVYDWQFATPGDEASPVTVAITREKVRQYAAMLPDGNPAFQPALDGTDLRVPIPLVRIYAPLRRRELVAEKGADYPNHPTPAVRWLCRFLGEPRVGTHVVSVTRVKNKYVKNERHFLEWEVVAHAEDGEPLLRFGYVNLWDRGKAEDRNR